MGDWFYTKEPELGSESEPMGPITPTSGSPGDDTGPDGGSMYMSYGGGYGDTGGGDGTGFFGGSGSIFGGSMRCCIQNMLIAGIVIFMLYTYVYLPMQHQEMQERQEKRGNQSRKMNSSQKSSFQSSPDVTVDGVKKFLSEQYDNLGNYISSLRK